MSTYRFRLLVSLFLFTLLLLPMAGLRVAATSEPEQVAGAQLVSSSTPPSAPNARVQAVREGKWPAQLAASRGDIAPDRHGPQRNDPAEGIPEHAYSPFDERVNRKHPCPPGGCEFEPGQVLVKLAQDQRALPRGKQMQGRLVADEALNEVLRSLGVTALEPVFPQAQRPTPGMMIQSPDGDLLPMPDLTRWYRARIVQGPRAQGQPQPDVYHIVGTLSQTPGIAWAEPDYLRKPLEGGDGAPLRQKQDAPLRESASFDDPLYGQQWHLPAVHAEQAWNYLSSQGLPPGGNRDIVVAVIDTGVDYTHPDLAANMWTNSREIPDNGVDDDGNGFVDDVHGANVVSNQHSGDPMDDHGHGTHVAGIIAAQADNGIGGVGVAYNVQIMAIKAAQYSGVLSASDIAEGIYYAVQQGADVINMSFGGYARSQVEEDALAVAFGQAVLVAAAGNDGVVNLPCPFGRDMYPAAYNWVLGVMASTQSGSRAGFSNFDCTPRDTHEYEVMAPGVDVWSTLPEENYAAWDGTSMAAPIVSGIAALARTKWSDKDVYSSRFIMGQIAANAQGGVQGVVDAYAALTQAPQPHLSYLEHWLFDTTAQDPDNDDDGIVDAGETIDLAIVIRNHWGKADPVTVTLEAWAEGAYQPDPYVTMITDTVSYGAIGSFNQDDNGLIYDDQGVITGVRHPFRFRVDPNTPNDHVIPFKLTMTARNGLDPTDTTVYTFTSRFYLIVQRGRELPRIIDHDMVLTKDNFWIVSNQILIEAGVTVTVTQGAQIQFFTTNPSNPYNQDQKALIQNEGRLLILGTPESPVELFPDDLYTYYGAKFSVVINTTDSGYSQYSYCNIRNPIIISESNNVFINHCLFNQDEIFVRYPHPLTYDPRPKYWDPLVQASVIQNSQFVQIGWWYGGNDYKFKLASPTETSLFDSCYAEFNSARFASNVFLRNYKPFSDWYVTVSRVKSGVGYACVNCESQFGRSQNQFKNNAILNLWHVPVTTFWMLLDAPMGREFSYYLTDNYWGTTSTLLIDAAIVDFNDDPNRAVAIYEPLSNLPESTYPFVADVVLSTAGQANMSALNGPTPIVGAEPVTFTVSFNRDMDTSIQPAVSFGPDVPETDYTIHPIDGGWVDARTWQGTFNITPVTGDGYQLIRVAGAVAADDPWLVTGDDAGRFRFEIQTSGTEAMNMQATGGEGYIDLQWTQDDFDLLAGFNLYRSTSQDGAYSLINQGLIPPDQRAFRDANVQPGQTYYYKFTVVKTDMTESDPSNIASATPIDTIPPTITHTPVTEAPPGLPLTIFADVTDNVGVQGVALYYRHIGDAAYQSKAMVKTTGNRYSATIAGALVTSPGIEYYIEATDGVSTVRYGRSAYPYQVAVVDRPVVTAVSPNRGPTSGGTVATIAGSNFKAGASVTFGGAAASNVTVLSSSQITCTTPAHFPATVDVTVTNPDGQSGTLLRGFTYESDVVSLSLPDTGGGQHDIVQVPINAANVNGLAAADLTITFEPNVLSARSASTGNLTPGWNLVANTATPGQVRLSIASPGGAVSGSGVLAYIEFEVTGTPGVTTTMHIASATLNDGAIPVDTADGSFTVSLVYDVSGTVRFWNGGAGVPAALLTLEGDRVYTGQSDATGSYRVSGAPAGAYILTPSKSDDVNGISAYDASLALQHAAGLISLSGYAATAADVNKSGAITSMDAFYILQKAVGLIALPFPGAGVVWDFDPQNRSYANLNSDLTGQDFTAILLGDVSGNWAAGAQMASTVTPVHLQIIPGSTPGVAVIHLDPAQTPVYGLELRLHYDASSLQDLAITPGPLAQGLAISSNLGQAGEARIALAGATPLTQAGDLLTLHWQPAPAANALPHITWAQVNEGRAAVDIPAPPAGSSLFLPLLVR